MNGKSFLNIVLLPVVLIIIGVAFSYYVVNYPQDKIVSDFISYGKILEKLFQHIYIVLISGVIAILTAFPLGVVLTRPRFRKLTDLVVNVVSIGQTIPSLAIVALFVGLLGVGAKTAIFALWLYSLLPILNNTLAGITGVSESVIESSRGMGLTQRRILFKIEIPLAMPVIIAGIRTAIIINIGTAIIAAFVGAGGLGDLIIAGNNINRWQILTLGAGMSVLLAVFADYIMGVVEQHLVNF